jgi:phosphotransferase family enzyme
LDTRAKDEADATQQQLQLGAALHGAPPMALRPSGAAHPRVRAELSDLRALVHDGSRLRLQRVWPTRDQRLALEYRHAAGGVVAAQWAPRADLLDWLAERTPGGHVVGDGAARVLLHPAGVDRRLPALARLLAEPGARLVTHRAEQRAVVQTAAALDTTYATVTVARDAAWTAEAATIAQGLAGGAFAVPTPAWSDAERGIVAFPGLPGSTLRERLTDSAPDRGRSATAAGRALRALHDARAPSGVPLRGAAQEIARLDASIERLMPHAPGLACLVADALGPVAARLRTFHARPAVPVHGDFHDGQVVDSGGSVGIFSWDGLGAGDRALDLASLTAHLEVRALEKRCSTAVAAAALRAVRAGYEVSSGLSAHVAAYADVVRLRLACEHALRPGGAQLAWLLVRRVGRNEEGRPR